MKPTFFFNGSIYSKLDDKNRFVLPQQMRDGLIENGELKFTLSLGLGGCLAIYKRSDIERIVEKFRRMQHLAKYQKAFTYFFSTLHHSTCDKLGRVVLPPVLKRLGKIESEIVIAGVLNRIEIWPKEGYEKDLEAFFGKREGGALDLTEALFASLDDNAQEKAFQRNQEQETCEEVGCHIFQ